MIGKTSKSKAGGAISFIFGLVFLLSGLGAAYAIFGKMTLNYFSSSDWQKVPASISSLKLKQNSNDTSSVKAEYVYYFQDVEFQSDAVALSNANDNIGSYWQDLYTKLRQERANDSVMAWVNPAHPSEAFLDRTFRWANVAFGSLFLLMFGGFGLLFMWASVKAAKSEDQIISEARIHGISANEKSGYWFLFWFGSIFFLMGAFFLILALPSILNEGEYAALFTLLFVVIGAGIMIFSYGGQQRYKVIGPTPLYLDPLPGSIAGQIGGKFHVASNSKNTPISVTLTCKKRVKSGKNTRTTLLWQKSMQAYAEQTGRGMSVRFLFDCQKDLPDSSSPSVVWEVRAEGTIKIQSKAIKLERNWNIPVDKAPATSSSIDIPERFLQQQEELRSQAAKTDAACLIKFNQQGRFLELESLSERPLGAGFGGILIGLLFGGIGMFTIGQDWWPGYIFAAVSGVIICASIFLLGRGIEVKVDTSRRVLHMRRNWFGIVLYQREVMLFDPSQFTIKKTSSTSTNKNLMEYFKVQVKDKEKQVLVAEGIKGKDVAEALMNGIIEQAFPMRF